MPLFSSVKSSKNTTHAFVAYNLTWNNLHLFSLRVIGAKTTDSNRHKDLHLKVRAPIAAICQWFLTRPRPIKRVISLSVDVFAVCFALWLAFSLRLSTLFIPPSHQWWLFPAAVLLALPVFIKFGLYRAVIRYIGMDAIWAIIRAVLLFTLLFMALVLFAGPLAGVVPRTVFGINAILLLILTGGTRLLARWVFTRSSDIKRLNLRSRRHIPPVIIYGAGHAGAQLAAMLKMSNQLNPVAFIDDAPSLHKQVINGIVVHPFENLAALMDKYRVRDVLLAMPSLSRSARNEIIEKLESYPVHVRTLPDFIDLAEGRISVSDIREVDIADLLGREPVAPQQDLLEANIRDKVVMVTGAGGSIGSELCRQIVRLSPRCLILFEINEFALYNIEQELRQTISDDALVVILGSVLDQARLNKVCRRFSVNTIYHAAAYKHVPMVEKNIREGIRNNVFGTLNCAQSAIECGVETFVLISTDKAVRPTNTMGASKRMAELVLQGLAADKQAHSHTRFTMVRFGNVLDSSGSVVPLFRQQIASGGPVTVTHPEIIRYFMTIPEAATLVIQAGALGQGGDVFVLDMGTPVKIVDLARRMIHLSGFTVRDSKHPDGDIEIIFTGLRHGEKLYEELLIGDNDTPTVHPKIMTANERIIPWVELGNILQDLEQAVIDDDYQAVRQLLCDHVDGYQPQCDIEDWLRPD